MSTRKSTVKKAASKADAKRARDVARIESWKSELRKSPEYRAREAARQRERMEQLRKDAAVGRSAQFALNGIVSALLSYGGLGDAIDFAIERALDARGVKPRTRRAGK